MEAEFKIERIYLASHDLLGFEPSINSNAFQLLIKQVV